MLIKKLELENIKSHRNSTFEFSKGTTAITGENGAGKTTIIEAIAWALFDVLDYKKDEFLSRGSKKGNVNVTFESGADGRDYVVYRDTGAGYHVYDPQLGLRIAEKRAEVGRFLWEHLGVEPGTDLSSLFKHAIGVPQGTLTAIFLSSPAERKATFDTLLKVEEYRRAADELLRTQRFVESGIADVREKVARTEGQLQEADEVDARLKAFRKELEDLTAEVARLTSEADKLTASVAEMDRLAAAAAAARSAWEKAQAEKTRCETVLAQKQVELAEAREASTRIDEVREPSAKYEHAMGRLTELERERIARDKLTHTLREIETAEARVKADQKHTFERLERIQKAHGEKTRLGPAVAEQDRLEKELDEIRRNHARELAAAERVKELESRRDQLRERYSDNGTALKDAQAAAAGAKVLAQVEARESDIVRRLAAMRAELERDERFQAEIQNGLCPILSERCLNLKEGQTLESFVSSQFDTLRAGIVTLESERTATAVQVKAARDAERAAERIASLEQRQSEIAAEGKRVAVELDTAAEAAKRLSAVEGTMKGLEEQLRKLENPRATLAVLEKEAAGEIEVRESLSTIESNIERLESERRSLVEDLENYKDLDAMWAEAVGIRDSNAEAHRTFLKYQRSAEALTDREKAFGECEATVVRAAAEMAEAENALKTAEAGYDADRHSTERQELAEFQRKKTECTVRRENAEARVQELEAKQQRFAEFREKLGAWRAENKELDKVLETTRFIRDTLKEAAPLVARNYVYHVSAEANNLFREIFGNAEQSLRWCEDYGIVLEEGGHERSFQSLSGGEQMAAALAVRLALLKQLSDIRIAFFDEPTTNMDADRRENLAMQIGQITHFDQLFVISHDDTFEGYLDHEIRVEK